jgi:hypothetical protein
MDGTAPFFPFAIIAIPTAGQCLMLLAPVAAVVLVRWVLGGIDQVIHRLFPSLEWHRELGWLNIRAERRAAAFFRWLNYAVYAALALALAGIVWGAIGIREIWQWSDPYVLGRLALRLPVLVTCLGLWLLYLGAELGPKLRREYEEEELEKFREQLAAQEEDGGKPAGPRHQAAPQLWTKSPLIQQRPRSQR